MVKMICNVYSFLKNTCKYNKAYTMHDPCSDICKMCEQQPEDILHCIILCSGYGNERDVLYEKVKSLNGINLTEYSESERLLKLLQISFLTDTNQMKTAEIVVKFVYAIHKKGYKLCTDTISRHL